MDVADHDARESTITFKCVRTFPTKSFYVCRNAGLYPKCAVVDIS